MSDPRSHVRRLQFVYNADATLVGIVTDFAHRTLAPDTYQCNLCDLTYGMFTKKKEWGRFIASLPFPVSFHTRDRFARMLARAGTEADDAEFPAVFVEYENGDVVELISADEINTAETLDDLEAIVTEKVVALD